MPVLRHSIASTPALDWSVPAARDDGGFVTADHILPPGQTLVHLDTP